jgi:hypothetical protein
MEYQKRRINPTTKNTINRRALVLLLPLPIFLSDCFITLTRVWSLKIKSRIARIRNTPTAIENPIIIF